MGRAGSGKTHLIAAIKGDAKLSHGKIKIDGEVVDSGREVLAWRLTPQGWARRLAGKHRTAGFAEALTACGLWEVRKDAISHLSPSQIAACDILPLLLKEGDLLLTDCGFDELDAWVLPDALDMLLDRVSRGAAAIVGTRRPDVAVRLGAILAIRREGGLYAGKVGTLIDRVQPNLLEVETDDRTSVKAIAAPFALEIREVEGGLEIECEKGQELAAKLLTQGYGSVRLATLKRPTLGEALRTLI